MPFNSDRPFLTPARALALLALAGLAAPAQATLITGFDAPLASVSDTNGVPMGTVTFSDAGSNVAPSTTTGVPALVPGSLASNAVLKMTVDMPSGGGFAGVSEIFYTPGSPNTFASQNWSGNQSISFWFYGYGDGASMFMDVFDNRDASGTANDGIERWTVNFIDSALGWQQVALNFSDFVRKDVFPNAPNDGFGLTEVHGWALGAQGEARARDYYFDDIRIDVHAVPEPASLALLALGLGLLVTAGRRRRTGAAG